MDETNCNWLGLDRLLQKRGIVARWLFIAAYALWLLWKITAMSMFSFSEGSLVNSMIHAVLLLLFVGSGMLAVKKDANLLMGGLLLLIGVMVKICSDEFAIIDLAVILFASKAASLRDIAKVTLAMTVAVGVGIVVCSQVGIIPDYPFSRGETVRHGLGFLYSTYSSHLYLNVVLLLFYLRGVRQSPLVYIALTAVNVIVFYLTDSRNSFILTSVFLALAAVLALSRERGLPPALLKLAGSFFFGILAVAMFALSLAYAPSNPVMSGLNGFMSNRLQQTRESLNMYDFTLFGQETEFVGNGIAMGGEVKFDYEVKPEANFNFVDCAYINLYIRCGAIPLFLLLALFTAAGWIGASNGDALVCSIFFIVAVHCAFDTMFIEPHLNPFLFLAWGIVCNYLDSRKHLSGRTVAGAVA